MDKIKVVVSAPIDTYSGYGARSRDFVKALLDIEKYEVKVLSQRWGNTRFGYLEDHQEDLLSSLIVPNLTEQPDVFFQITVPNEFQKVGKYNIGVTAAIETTVVDPSWIEGCNRMDLILASSNHSKSVLTQTTYDRKDKKTGTPLAKLQTETPVEVLFEGVDIQKYFPSKTYSPEVEINSVLDTIKESWCWLFVGSWMQGDLRQDRKNVGLTVQKFLESYKNKKNPPALILKTHQATTSIMDRARLEEKIAGIRSAIGGNLPNIYLLHGDLTDSEMNHLYNHPKVKAMVSLTKGEGFGRPLLEFSAVGKPIMASGWSGQLDFLNKDFSYLLPGQLEQVHQSAVVKNMILPESKWFQVDDNQVNKGFKTIFKDYKKYNVLGKKQGHKNREQFNYTKMVELLESILNRSLPEFPKQVELTLPKLNLPKLKKL